MNTHKQGVKRKIASLYSCLQTNKLVSSLRFFPIVFQYCLPCKLFFPLLLLHISTPCPSFCYNRISDSKSVWVAITSYYTLILSTFY